MSDINKDGIPDIAYGSSSNDLGVCIGDGSGHWTNASTGLPTDEYNSYGSILLDDLNGDGNIDLLGGSLLSQGMTLWLGDGTGHWTKNITSLPNKNEYYDLQYTDINYDGHKDLLAIRAGYIFAKPAQLEIRLGDGKGNWSVSENITLGKYGYAVAIGDFNNDGIRDLATGSEAGVCCWKNDTPVPEFLPIFGIILMLIPVIVLVICSNVCKFDEQRYFTNRKN